MITLPVALVVVVYLATLAGSWLAYRHLSRPLRAATERAEEEYAEFEETEKGGAAWSAA
jgi:peptidoglycan/LPS O-acetylase OafA/YrhL